MQVCGNEYDSFRVVSIESPCGSKVNDITVHPYQYATQRCTNCGQLLYLSGKVVVDCARAESTCCVCCRGAEAMVFLDSLGCPDLIMLAGRLTASFWK